MRHRLASRRHWLARFLRQGHHASVVLELGDAVLVTVNGGRSAGGRAKNRLRVDTGDAGDPLVECLHRTIEPNRVSQDHVSIGDDATRGKGKVFDRISFDALFPFPGRSPRSST